MKNRIASFVLALIIISSFSASAFAQPSVSAESAVLMCAENGKVLFSKNSDSRMSMASTTKIMTSLIAIEAAIPDKEITVTKEMVSVEGTSMGLVAGDSVSMNELIYGMLLQSGNDAAHTVACVLAGSEDGFAKLMNERAAEIGMKNSSFATASGLDRENHYSTAYDMALLACECIKNPVFASICSKKSARLTYGNPPYARTLTNHNRLLWSYEGCIGLKTGFTKKSGRCLVSAAKRDGITLVAVTLNAPNDWNDHISMLDYGFSQLEGFELSCDLSNIKLPICGGKQSFVNLRQSFNPIYPADGSGYSCEILIRRFEYAPIKQGAVLGKAVYYSGGRVIAEVPLEASETVERKTVIKAAENEEKGAFFDLIEKIKELFRGEFRIGR